MRMNKILSGVLVAAGIAIASPIVAASPAAAVPCSLRGQSELFGRTVNLWSCAGDFHGQITGAQAVDSVEVRVRALFGTSSFGKQYVQAGSTTVNSLSIRGFGAMSPFSACLHIGDRPGEVACT